MHTDLGEQITQYAQELGLLNGIEACLDIDLHKVQFRPAQAVG